MVTRSSVKSATAEASTARTKRRYCTGRAQRMNTETGETFNIESIVCGDGEKAANGMALRTKTWNAWARVDGGVESYNEKYSRTLILSTRVGLKGETGVLARSRRQQRRRLRVLFLVSAFQARSAIIRPPFAGDSRLPH